MAEMAGKQLHDHQDHVGPEAHRERPLRRAEHLISAVAVFHKSIRYFFLALPCFPVGITGGDNTNFRASAAAYLERRGALRVRTIGAVSPVFGLVFLLTCGSFGVYSAAVHIELLSEETAYCAWRSFHFLCIWMSESARGK
jgi:hypothetical protein